MNTLSPPADCCSSPCPDSSSGSAGPPGPKGDAGANGAAGADGKNAFTTTNGSFAMPAVAASVTIPFLSTAWMVIGQAVFIQGAGYFSVASVASAVSASLTNLGYTGNVAPTTVVATAKNVSPAGIKGTDGAAGSSTLNDLSPTTTKGDLIADNGANNPAANAVRLAVGTNGQMLCADSTAGTGLAWKTVVPVSVSSDNAIPRFNGASGTPTPLQDSKMLITDDGALQSTPSGGNARGSMAVDLQVDRAAVTQVASGADAVVAGGSNNTASGSVSSVGGGSSNTASGVAAVVPGGSGNTASGDDSTVCGGASNGASGDNSTVVGGSGSTASGDNSTVVGGNGGSATGDGSSILGGTSNSASAVASATVGGASASVDKYGQIGHASGLFAAAGDAQASELIWRKGTTDATANVELFLDGASAKAVIPLNTVWAFHIHLVARSSAGVCAAWETKGAIQNNANTVSLVAAVTQAVISDGTGGTWGVTGSVVVDADNTAKSLRIRVTGVAATNIRWCSHARLVELSF